MKIAWFPTNWMSCLLLVFWGQTCSLTPSATAQITVPPEEPEHRPADREFDSLPEFIAAYCVDCHQGEDAAGERDFQRLALRIESDGDLTDFQDVLDQLNLGEMPPADAKQPSDELRLGVAARLTEAIKTYHEHRQSAARPEVIQRRLNAREYRNAIRDLFGLNMTIFDPTVEFPRDQRFEHLDNVGDELVTSGFLLAKYLEAADRIVNRALFPLEQPVSQTWRFSDGFRQQPEIDQVHGRWNQFKHLTLYDAIGADKHEGAYAPIHAFADGAPHDGYYEIEFAAGAFHRDHAYDDAFFGTDRREPFRLGIVAGHQDVGPLHKPQPIEPLLGEVELTDDMQTYRLRIWLDQGYTFRFTFRNGLMDVRNVWSRIHKKYPEQLPQKGKGIVFFRRNAITNGQIPHIRVDDIAVRGPIYDQWPKPSQLVLLGSESFSNGRPADMTSEQTEAHLAKLMDRAFRRPASAEEIASIQRLIETRKAAGSSPLEAYADGVKAVLCSPHFLYWNEPPTVASKPGPTKDEGSPQFLASRLAAFLWSSLPDEQLLGTDFGGADRQAVIAQEVERLLDSPKSAAFVSGFLDSWLTLGDLGSSPPDRTQFPDYYHYNLQENMRHETELFFRHLLTENMSIMNFLDTDFTFANKRLAEHYGLDVPEDLVSDPFRFVQVPLNDSRRGGLLGHASVLTVSANGIDTSPVVRGVWLLENLLGTPPSPPPPDVEPLDPDVRGAKTVRDQLRKHRSDPNCNACHQKIDPLGFALENFDAIGSWRTKYAHGAKIDASGVLPDGTKFEDITGLKAALFERSDLFCHALIEKLLMYGLGRKLTPLDRPEIDRLAAEAQKANYRFRDLISMIASSRLFSQP